MKWYIKRVLDKIPGEGIKGMVKKTLKSMKHPADVMFWGKQFGTEDNRPGYSDITEAQQIFKEGFEAGIWWNDNAPRD